MARRSRRGFLKGSLAGIAGASLASPASLAQAQSAASGSRISGANRRVRIGVVGCGGMGTADLRDMLRNGCQLVALCDVDDAQAAKAREFANREFSQTPDLVTRDFRRVLERSDIDAVVVATPDHWHALVTIAACEAGKDVYVEKPLSLSIGEGRVMVDVARRTNRVVQMGTQQRSAPHYNDAVDYVRSGNIPRVPDSDPPPGVDYDFWLGPAPKRPFNKNRFHFNFRWYYDYSGGLMTDWGAHMIDIANWGMNVIAPKAAVSVGGKFGFPDDAEETPDTQQALWEFDGFSMIWEHATAIGQGPYMRDYGVAFHGNNGVLVVDRGGWEVLAETETPSGSPRRFRMAGEPRRGTGGTDSHLAHVKNFLECMDSRARPRSDVEIGHNSMIACHLGNIAYRIGRRVAWDVAGEKVMGDPEAQALVTRPYRAPWSLQRPAASA
jgi:predicted dehydrogenase